MAVVGANCVRLRAFTERPYGEIRLTMYRSGDSRITQRKADFRKHTCGAPPTKCQNRRQENNPLVSAKPPKQPRLMLTVLLNMPMD